MAETVSALPPLSSRTTLLPAVSPETVPPIVKDRVAHATATPVTLVLPTVPVPFVTVQVWLGPEGCVRTVTA